MTDERTPVGLALAVVVIALVGAAYVSPWWTYEDSTGRQTAPEGPHDPSFTAEESHTSDFYIEGWRGDVEPSNLETAANAMLIIKVAMIASAVAMLPYILGQIRGISNYITRHWCMAFAAIAVVGSLTALIVTWTQLPAAMAGYGITEPFSSELLEEGYIRSYLNIAWILTTFTVFASIAAVLAAYSAGNADPRVITQWASEETA